MAHALRKLLRHSDHNVDKREVSAGNMGDCVAGGPATGSPSDTARRLLARACNRDAAKVCPAEKTIGTTPTTTNTHNNSSNTTNNNNNVKKGGALSRASSFFKSKKNHLMNETSIHHSKLVRTRRLMKEYQEMCRQQLESDTPVFTVELVDDNLFEWNVKLLKVDPESELFRDMQELCTPYVLLNLTFPDNFPFAPPFMRVITPRIEKGFVMEGGAICMELLTPRGWASAYTVEAVIMQFAASLVKGQARIARKAKGTKEFSRKSAEASFRSLVKTHEKYGWVTPPLSDG